VPDADDARAITLGVRCEFRFYDNQPIADWPSLSVVLLAWICVEI
jgi:hypothetical protein